MDIIKLTPSEIRFSQDSISNTFGDDTDHAGQYIGETLDEIVEDPFMAVFIPNTYMLSGCELIDTENISLPSQNMKFVGE